MSGTFPGVVQKLRPKIRETDELRIRIRSVPKHALFEIRTLSRTQFQVTTILFKATVCIQMGSRQMGSRRAGGQMGRLKGLQKVLKEIYLGLIRGPGRFFPEKSKKAVLKRALSLDLWVSAAEIIPYFVYFVYFFHFWRLREMLYQSRKAKEKYENLRKE